VLKFQGEGSNKRSGNLQANPEASKQMKNFCGSDAMFSGQREIPMLHGAA
jgi:hypothetical protein